MVDTTHETLQKSDLFVVRTMSFRTGSIHVWRAQLLLIHVIIYRPLV